MFSTELEFVKKILSKGAAIPYHAYALGTGIMNKKRSIACRNIKVGKDYSLTMIPGPYLEANVLADSYALLYRTCPSDSSCTRSFYFGDIRVGPIKETSSSFVISWSKEDFISNISSPLSEKQKIPAYMIDFKKSIIAQADVLWEYINKEAQQAYNNKQAEGIKNLSGLYIHFDFTDPLNVTQWYDMPGSVDILDQVHLEFKGEEMFGYEKSIDRYALKKSLIHTLASGDEKSDNQFPDFDLKNRYKSLSLAKDDLKLMFYHAKILQACKVPIPKSDPYHFRIIPSGDFKAADAEAFLVRLSQLRDSIWHDKDIKEEALEDAESQITDAVSEEETSVDPADILNDAVSSAKNISAFNLILVRDGGKVFMNVSEISSISRSCLLKNLRNINEVSTSVRNEYKLKFKPTVSSSFYKIHNKIGKGEKFQQKFVNTLFKIYRGAYYGDPDLSRLFLERALYDIRANGFNNYRIIKMSYEFLTALDQTIKGEEKVPSKSKDLGKMCGNVSWQLVYLIGSYEKSQLGYIRNRIRNIQDVKKFLGESSSAVLRHEGENKTIYVNGKDTSRITIQSEGEAQHKANQLIEEIEDVTKDFNRDDFIIGLLNQVSLRKFTH